MLLRISPSPADHLMKQQSVVDDAFICREKRMSAQWKPCLAICKDGAKNRSDGASERQHIHQVVRCARGQLHEAAEALEAPVRMRLQVDRYLMRRGELLCQALQRGLGVYVSKGRLIQALHGVLQGISQILLHSTEDVPIGWRKVICGHPSMQSACRVWKTQAMHCVL